MTTTKDVSGPGLVRWGVAASTARTLASAGPRLSTSEAVPIVEDIRAKAAASVEHVHRITGLEAARNLRDSEVLVVDRSGWATAAVQGFREMLDEPLRASLSQRLGGTLPFSLRVGGYGVGVEVGSLVAFLASHVLGQYDPFSVSPTAPGGRLLLVAPNIVEVERSLNVEPEDFRLWVALHEQTHRVQFAAAPWLRGYLSAQITALSEGMLSRPGSLTDRVKSLTGVVRKDTEMPDAAGQGSAGAAASGVAGAASQGAAAADGAAGGEPEGGVPAGGATAGAAGGAGTGPEPLAGGPAASAASEGMGLLDLVVGPAEQEALSRVTAVMSLLEGHANVVMDAVDSSVVPTVRTIRNRFDQRGQNRSALQKLVMRVIGMAAKQRQYKDGAAFVRAGVDALGMDGFNVVWERAENLPTEAELHEPEKWVARMRAAS